MSLIVERLSEKAILPRKAHANDLGYDLYAAESDQILPGETKIISTGIRILFPEKIGAKIFDRSSVATQQNLTVLAGVIDNGYRGEIKIALYNTGKFIRNINIGDRIAQMILIPIIYHDIVEGLVNVEETTRKDDGFGSTGS